ELFSEVAMQTKVTFRHFKGNHPQLHEEAIELSKSFEKYHDGIISSNVVFVNDTLKTVEFTVHLQGTTLKATESSDDFHKSLHTAGEKIIRQIRKYKTKHFESKINKSTPELVIR
ncbi:MAG TPA: ribosome-associated translation inhibitor RaiA, partial [Candidatus Kapabacteria bacterium]|nr:ribosome-associated translation inhibitor RaiA [Candidatus Kapabacteria bacterium]